MLRCFALAPLGATLLTLTLGCSDDATTHPPGSSSSTGAGGGGGGAVCDVHATTGAAHWTDRSEAWGLTGAKIVGNRIVSGDLDGDGYPDLVIHAIGSNNREPIAHGPRLIYVLMNEPGPSGGRVFVDRTSESGYASLHGKDDLFYHSAHLAALADIDNDGDLDVFSGVYTAPDQVHKPPSDADLDRSRILLNDGAGHLLVAPPSDIAPTKPMPTIGASFADVDRDGVLDLFVGFHYSGNSQNEQTLFHGAGDGTFTNVSADTGIAGSANRRAAFAVGACDVNDDGAPDLLVSAYGRGPNILFQNDGTGHFADVGVTSGYAYDANMDYSDNEFFKCWCTVHTTSADCAGVGQPALVCPTPADANWYPSTDTKPPRLGGNTFTTLCSDVTGDGHLDLYNAEIAHWWAGQSSDKSELLVNRTDESGIHFERPGQAATGMTWEHVGVDWNEGGLMAAAADLDNDGREDVVVAASDYPDQYGLYFHQSADGTFQELGEASGFHHPCTSGLTVADFDRDGDLDLVVGSGTARDCAKIWSSNEVHLYENDASTVGHWLIVRLVGDGTTTNRSAFGARVVADAGGVKLTKELVGSYGHMSMENDTVLFFGLGGCGTVDALEVTWPDSARSTQTFENVAADRVIELVQGQADVRDVVKAP